MLDQCTSFQQPRDVLPSLLYQCRPDTAEVQRWYVHRGQYDFVLDDDTDVTQLTRENSLRSGIQAGAGIVMRIIIEEAVSSFLATYRCRCGTWNDTKVSTVSLPDASKHGYSITCRRCKRWFQIIYMEGKRWRIVPLRRKKAMITNRHEKRSTLLAILWRSKWCVANETTLLS